MRTGAALFVALIAGAAALAGAGQPRGGRAPVVDQVDLPHSYYWRELYLPQPTTGPSAVAFLPDGQELIYSMAGSLWRQRLGTTEATELTHADAAYDDQPDVAGDGGSVVFTRYDGRAIELWLLWLADGREQRLTRNGGVNVEPRIAPDGRRLVWVSTAGTGHFNLMIADLSPAGLGNIRPLVAPRRSAIARYYYSAHDHAINPSWSPDGRTVYYVGNAEIPWGSGSIQAVAAPTSNQTNVRHLEETTWAARPELAPDGRRLLFSSYHGRPWHQLWLTTPQGAAPLPLTFGDFDRRNARWSPDGERIAYISNERGNTALFVQEFTGGARQEIVAATRRYQRPATTLALVIGDAEGKELPARVAVLGSDSRWHAPAAALLHGDDGYDRTLQPGETRYFHCAARCELVLPAGPARLLVWRGLRYRPWQASVALRAGARTEQRVTLTLQDLPAEFGAFVSADLHVHMNYGGHYRMTPERLLAQARAEDLDVVYNLIVNKEERIPDLAYFQPAPDPASDAGTLLLHAQEFHTSRWGHLGLLHLAEQFLLPDFAAYRHTALASPWPHNGVVADLAHAQGALVGYVHPFDWEIVPEREKSLTHQLPADVAHGKVDYLEVVGFSDHKATAQVWYRLLNLGFRLPAGAGTDAMANYASLRGPVGLNRVFLDTGGARTPAALSAALRAGRSFATNSALLGLKVGGQHPGGVIADARGPLPYRIALRSPVPIGHLELVHNGRVIRQFDLAGDRRQLDASGELQLAAGGWLLLRAWNDAADPLVLDLYPYATTSPIWLESPPPPPAPADAAYFVAWLTRVITDTRASTDFNNERERRATLDYLESAQARFRRLASTPGGQP
ncbi:MAG: hypothetical protein FJ191_02795 [Gammaproteobacteria bacterium]|nr:hypothetical protein [Gammaproteobacteria bacterium]